MTPTPDALIDLATAFERGDITRDATVIAKLKALDMHWLARSFALGMTLKCVIRALRADAERLQAHPPS